jgi:flagellar biosynthetic protein FlhB
MADDDSTEKTEDPTAKRLRDARDKGNVARSGEIDTAFFILFFLIILAGAGKYVITVSMDMFRYSFENLNIGLNLLNARNLYWKFFVNFWIIMLPIGALFIIGNFISLFLQVGWLVSFESLKPKFDLFKMENLTNMFNMQAVKKLVKGIVKLIVLLIIAYMTVRKHTADMLGLVNLEVVDIYIYLTKLVVKILTSLLIFYIFFAVIDFVWNKFDYKKKLKMTKSEVKDEFKQMEGDPQVKRKILQLMMEESMKRMMQEVPTADVVITNPIHLAIAIKYDKEVSDAPLVVAKGKRLIAEKIKEIAREYDIPIVEDKPLARLLYKESQVGQAIDVQFYAAVAEILANVYKMKNKAFT